MLIAELHLHATEHEQDLEHDRFALDGGEGRFHVTYGDKSQRVRRH